MSEEVAQKIKPFVVKNAFWILLAVLILAGLGLTAYRLWTSRHTEEEAKE